MFSPGRAAQRAGRTADLYDARWLWSRRLRDLALRYSIKFLRRASWSNLLFMVGYRYYDSVTATAASGAASRPQQNRSGVRRWRWWQSSSAAAGPPEPQNWIRSRDPTPTELPNHAVILFVSSSFNSRMSTLFKHAKVANFLNKGNHQSKIYCRRFFPWILGKLSPIVKGCRYWNATIMSTYR